LESSDPAAFGEVPLFIENNIVRLRVKDGLAKRTTGPFTPAPSLLPPPGRQPAFGQLQLEACLSVDKSKLKGSDPLILTFMNALSIKENERGTKKAELSKIEACMSYILSLLHC